ncbi:MULTISPECIES: transglycosylase SLT domain-containing protein [Hyphobacterium]|uniref:Transglycosylase SLT domain-containing protein n=1 Tax=Hyphobacterium vulgare TaxID=1736751 RepID=A0ABV6ZX97_9PROT
MRKAVLPLFIAATVLSACGHYQPDQVTDACLILEDNRSWWRDLRRSERRWGIPPAIQLAILKRESSFNAHARPARTRLLGIIPGPRPSSAYGYAQALDGTWDWYRDETGNRGADRDDFGDAVDFIGWYGQMSGRLSNIRHDDARALYLAYHEGHTGYNRGTYRGRAWLIRAADDVASDAARYQSQLDGCERRLNRGRFWLL